MKDETVVFFGLSQKVGVKATVRQWWSVHRLIYRFHSEHPNYRIKLDAPIMYTYMLNKEITYSQFAELCEHSRFYFHLTKRLAQATQLVITVNLPVITWVSLLKLWRSLAKESIIVQDEHHQQHHPHDPGDLLSLFALIDKRFGHLTFKPEAT